MGLGPSPTPPPHSSGSPNKSFNSNEITLLEVGILCGCMCGPELPLWAGTGGHKLRTQAAEVRPAGSGQVGTHPETSIANCFPISPDHLCVSPHLSSDSKPSPFTVLT